VQVRVECYAGHRGEETPRRLFVDERAIELTEVLDQWLAPDHRYFKVLGANGALYILRYDVDGGFWDLTFLERRPPMS
jgi:hypothetical protein